VLKKDRTFAVKILLLILHFKHCPLQSSPLYWQYTVPNISSIVGMFPGTQFVWWRAVLLSHFPESLYGLETTSFQSSFKSGKQKKSLLGLSPENNVVGAQRMSDISPDNCGWGATRQPAHYRSATSKSGFPTIQGSSCAQHSSNALKLPRKTVFLPSDHVVQIRDGQCLSSQKTQPTSPRSLTDSSVFIFGRRDPFHIHCDDCILISTSYS